MSLQKPFNINIRGQTIDGNDPNIIRWQVSGDLSVAFAIDILNNADNSLVYSLPKTNSYSTSFNIPSGNLQNGHEYKIRIQIWNDKNQSIYSDFEVFQTSSRPVVTLNQIETISSPSYNFQATYSQAENVTMRSYVYYLYNSNQVLIAQSTIKTTQAIEHLFSNLQSENSYYIEIQATSNRGLVGTTGKVRFSVLYTQPQVNVSLEAENVENAGIKISWKTIQIIGQSDCVELSYIDNEKIDLRNGCVVRFDEGFSLQKNGTMKLWIEHPLYYQDLFVLRGQNGRIFMQYWDTDNRFHVFKRINGRNTHYVSIPVIGNAFFICIQQINDDLNVIAESIGEVIE